MRRYFLTGCTGFIGSAIVRELCKRDDTESITLLTRDPQARYGFYAIDKRVSLYVGNIVDCPFPETPFTDIIHGANDAAAGPFQPDIAYQIVEGTRRIVKWAGERPLLLLSSGAANAHAEHGPYGQAKATAEVSLRDGMKIARMYTLVGNGIPAQYAICKFVRQAASEGLVTVAGGSRIFRSYLHVEDCARWLLAIMERGEPCVPYDVGGETFYTIAEVAALVASVFEVPLNEIPGNDSEDAYLPDLTRTLHLGVKTTISLKTALERIRDDYRIRNPHLETSAAA